MRQGDVIVYEAKNSSDGYPGHVVVVEEVLGNGSFKVSTWNSGGDHRFHGTRTETHTPATGGGYWSGYNIVRYLIYTGSSDVVDTIETITQQVEDIEYITSERYYDYNLDN